MQATSSHSKGRATGLLSCLLSCFLLFAVACGPRSDSTSHRLTDPPPTVVPVTTPPANFSGASQRYSGYWFGYKLVICGSKATFNIPPAFRSPLDARIRTLLGDAALSHDTLPEPVYVSLLATTSSTAPPPPLSTPELFVNEVLELRRATANDCGP